MNDRLYKNFYDPTQKFASESRAFCYEIATQLLRQAKSSEVNWYENENTLKGILLLLFTWNFAAKKTKKLNFKKVRDLLNTTKEDLKFLENYSITTVNKDAWDVIAHVFNKFKNVFDQTGASKALSLLNPNLFVMWDTAIRKRLRRDLIPGIKNGKSGKYYVDFLKGIQGIIRDYNIEKKLPPNTIVAKKIDEFNYLNLVKRKSS